jgi:Fe-S oxidoreductase/nitrate reductase gamma subunit
VKRLGVSLVPFREDFIFIPGWLAFTFYVVAVVAVLALAYGIFVKTKPVGLVNLVNVYAKRIRENLSFVFREWFLQRRLMRRRYAGILHSSLFFGTLILFIGTIIVFVDYDLLRFLSIEVLQGVGYLLFEAVMDVAGLLFIVGVLLALLRRLVIRPSYLENRRWDYLVLSGLLYIGVTGFVLEGLRLAMKPVPWGGWSILGNVLAGVFRATGLPAAFEESLYQVLWFSHALVAFALIATLPYSPLLHIALSSTNILKTKLKPIGRITTPFKLAEVLQSGNFSIKIGFNTLQELDWGRRLSLLACTNCGRCQDACPATAAGRALNPRLVIQRLGAQLKSANWSTDVLQGVVSEEEVWGCTMCCACVQECPTLISTPDFIIDLRRHLIDKGRADEKMNRLLTNIQLYGNPFGARPQDRIKWTEGLRINTLDEEPNVEYLYWVGCAAAFDQRAQKIAKATAILLQKANVSFGILGVKERCTGEVVRRLGEEGLFQQTAMENIEVLKSYGVKKIVTHCPHCYNTLKNEYPELGGSFEVKHHTQLLFELIKEGRLKLKGLSEIKVALHDSCYLGRYNQIYYEPRWILQQIQGLKTIRIREKERSFCCGAGGANYWYTVNEHRHIPEIRLSEVVEAGANILVVECPYCLSMFEESRKTNDRYQLIEVKDISEIILDALVDEKQPS